MSVKAAGRQSPSHSAAFVSEVPEEEEAHVDPFVMVHSPDRGLTASLVLAPPSITAYIGRSLKDAQHIDIDLGGRAVTVSKVFENDARRAEEPQSLSLNGEHQDRVQTDAEFQILVAKVERASGIPRLELATDIATQRPGILLRNAVVDAFKERFGYVPIFDAQGIMDSSVHLRASPEYLQSDSHLTGMIRYVLPNNDEDGLEPLVLDHPIIYDATAEVDALHNTIQYDIDFHVEPPKKAKRKFCVIL